MRWTERPRRFLWSVPIGWQLGVLYALLLVVTLLTLGTALYTRLDTFLVQNTADRLLDNVRPLLVRGPLRDSTRYTPLDRQPLPQYATKPTPEESASYLVHWLSAPDVTVAVLDENGKELSVTDSYDTTISNTTESLLPTGWQTEVNDDDAPAQWVVGDGSARRLLVILPLRLPAQEAAATDPATTTTQSAGAQTTTSRLFVAQSASLGAANAVLDQVRLYLTLGVIFGTVIGLAVGLALTRLVLRPLDRMAVTADAIAHGDLKRRLRLPEGRNEVARLGRDFDYMIDRLAATLEAQRRFVADASHELRTPLTSLEGLSELLLMGADGGNPGAIQRAARSMHSELARLGRLVTDLLTLSRLDSAAPLQEASIDAGALLAAVVEQMTPLAAARHVRLEFNRNGALPVVGDADKLKQVIINLVDNAVRYTPEGGAIILRGDTSAQPGMVHLQVQDSGPGIPATDLEHIFERFYRGDPSRTRSTGNTGLGLAIARAIVEAHGGAIKAGSAPGAGATFDIFLPIKQAAVSGQRSAF